MPRRLRFERRSSLYILSCCDPQHLRIQCWTRDSPVKSPCAPTAVTIGVLCVPGAAPLRADRDRLGTPHRSSRPASVSCALYWSCLLPGRRCFDGDTQRGYTWQSRTDQLGQFGVQQQAFTDPVQAFHHFIMTCETHRHHRVHLTIGVFLPRNLWLDGVQQRTIVHFRGCFLSSRKSCPLLWATSGNRQRSC